MDSDSVSAASALAILKQIFRPSSPTNERALFRGRTKQLGAIVASIEEVGQHAIVFGDRGVGKTSLAYMASSVFTSSAPSVSLAVRITCDSTDDFKTACMKLIPRIQVEVDRAGPDVAADLQPLLDRVEDILQFDTASPDSVARALSLLAGRVPLLITVDEFDQLGDFASTTSFAHLVKLLADDFVPCTLVFVGVADDVSGLIEGHRSVERNLREIPVPRMTSHELTQIVVGGFETFNERSTLNVQCTERAVQAIVRLSQGFPYYTHLLAGALGAEAIMSNQAEIDDALVFKALLRAMDEASQQIRVSYTDAVAASRSDASYAQTLLACALAQTDDLGYFRPKDVAAPLTQITGVPKKTPNYMAHLNRFVDQARILETRGTGRMSRYRFHNPLMLPFVLMKGIQSGQISLEAEVNDKSGGNHR